MEVVMKSVFSADQADVALRAYEIFLDDAESLEYDLNDREECELGVAEAVSEAAYELSVPMVESIERTVIRVVVERLVIDGVIA